MVDAEKVKAGLRICSDTKKFALGCNECPYLNEVLCVSSIASDAAELIALLEERLAIMQESMETLEQRCEALEALEKRCNALEQRNEPIEPIAVPIGEDVSIPFIRYKCPKCGMFQIEFKPNYCSGCGQAVKWDG